MQMTSFAIPALMIAAGLVASSGAIAGDAAFCSQTFIKPGYSDEACLLKFRFCMNTPRVVIGAVKMRDNGTTEAQALENIQWAGSDCQSSDCGWYARNSRFVADTIRHIYSDENVYQTMKALIIPGDAGYQIVEYCMRATDLSVEP